MKIDLRINWNQSILWGHLQSINKSDVGKQTADCGKQNVYCKQTSVISKQTAVLK